jgi:multisubunit Na+/H+ antiporter MnhE subunit
MLTRSTYFIICIILGSAFGYFGVWLGLGPSDLLSEANATYGLTRGFIAGIIIALITQIPSFNPSWINNRSQHWIMLISLIVFLIWLTIYTAAIAIV